MAEINFKQAFYEMFQSNAENMVEYESGSKSFSSDWIDLGEKKGWFAKDKSEADIMRDRYAFANYDLPKNLADDMLYGINGNSTGAMVQLYGTNASTYNNGALKAEGGLYGRTNEIDARISELESLKLSDAGMDNLIKGYDEEITSLQTERAEIDAKIKPLEAQVHLGKALQNYANASELDPNSDEYKQVCENLERASLDYLEVQQDQVRADNNISGQDKARKLEELRQKANALKADLGIEEPSVQTQAQTQTQTQTAQVTEPAVKSNSVEKTATVEPEKEEKELTPEEQLESLQAQRDTRVASGINSASDAQQLSELDNQIKSLKSDLGIENETKTAEASDVKAQGSEDVKQTDEKKLDIPDFKMPERKEGMSDDDYDKAVIEQLADDIWTKGNWGNGAERVEKLTAAGFDAAAVQARINEKYCSVKTDDISTEHISLNDEIVLPDPPPQQPQAEQNPPPPSNPQAEVIEVGPQPDESGLGIVDPSDKAQGALVSPEQSAKNAEKAGKSNNQRRPLTEQQASNTNTEIKRTETKPKTESKTKSEKTNSETPKKDPLDFSNMYDSMSLNGNNPFAPNASTAYDAMKLGDGKPFATGAELNDAMKLDDNSPYMPKGKSNKNYNASSLDGVAGNNSTTAKSAELEQE